ncbi:glycine decarboxylase subunit P NDAI_0I01060 [Naumovozyma dairenensis CBS 421]|uniref:Glycine cleavage system P protein n=1 Tax=Naumovozyma dairenensis (strain ATCC 10597 / BCRC 20456 / CBS 421 / NBRC 0211 / NRRL Y-12639) TaxID=1071378 RepID=G0WFW4_NAUDC|nr:hypothetical protein NDAI_0I01060 [Naumovozyma dairenensis CBS 421]CCD26675.1 hypothetical protein NDAI_0I01060 [Naumovozyma dairenensis CBS 421]
MYYYHNYDQINGICSTKKVNRLSRYIYPLSSTDIISTNHHISNQLWNNGRTFTTTYPNSIEISSKQYERIYNNDPLDLSNPLDSFPRRHLGPAPKDVQSMLKQMGFNDLESFIKAVIPSNILNNDTTDSPLDFDLKASTSSSNVGFSEQEMLKHLTNLANKNNYKIKNFIGKGYYNTIVPPVIQRNLLECPEWYTSYTPYQPEISQGRLESLLNFQTVISDLTGLPIANASLLDEGTAAAEAMLLAFNLTKKKKFKFIVDKNVHKQTKSVLRTRAKPFNIELIEIDSVSDFENAKYIIKENGNDLIGCFVQYPDTNGSILSEEKLKQLAELTHGGGNVSKAPSQLFIVASDLMALTLLKPPGQLGADIVLGSSQRFGVPMGFGGPHAAFFSVIDKLNRKIPGRIVGVSKDRLGNPALRLALQTREQHIKRDKATSNICTAQALLANIAANYCVYHGPEGLQNIAKRIYGMTTVLAQHINSSKCEHSVINESWFDTLTIKLNENVTNSKKFLEKALNEFSMNLFMSDSQTISLSLDEATTEDDLSNLILLFSKEKTIAPDSNFASKLPEFPLDNLRTEPFLINPVFNKYHSETAMLRYLHHLQTRDLSLANSMIPLGSCTMKLNSTVEMMPITWPQFTNIHPFQPSSQTKGYQEMFTNLEKDLCNITGFDAISLQPNSGASGEYTGLRVIKTYLESQGQPHRNVCLIPISAHGTNPASAAMCGLKTVSVNCLNDGSLDLNDLKLKAEKYKDELAAVMITYPSTYGLFGPSVQEAFDIVHENGGQVYLDGANMNAQVGLTSPGFLGADVCHLNLHKTFAIPHGGGGPAGAPICVRSHLKPFLPGHDVVKMITSGGSDDPSRTIDSVSSAPYGNALVLPISYAYIRMMGSKGLPYSSVIAILNANYMMSRLQEYYKILFINGSSSFKHCGHEFIVDLREYKEHGIEAIDIAKRLQDYGFHAPTLAFPVPGTLMVEPTESENLEELDRFIESMISIKNEIDLFMKGDPRGKVLKMSPHSMEDIINGEDWEQRGYTREFAAYPLPFLKVNKFWPVTTRLDDIYGDTHLHCTCPSVEEMEAKWREES